MRAFLASHPVEMHGQTGHDSDGRALLYLYLEYLEYLHHSTQTTTAPKLLEESLQALPCVQGVLCVNVLKKKKSRAGGNSRYDCNYKLRAESAGWSFLVQERYYSSTVTLLSLL